MGILAALGSPRKVQFLKNGNTIIEFEASLSESHSRKSTPTEFPIENGNVINDHVILKPFELNLNVIITDNPISGIAGLLTESATTLTSKLTPPIGSIALGAGLGGLSAIKALLGADSPSVTAYKQLLRIQEHAEFFTVLTSLFRYPNMVISSLDVQREANNGRALVASIGLVQLTIVKPKSTNIKLANPGLSSGLNDIGQQGSGESPFIKGAKDGFSDTNSALSAVIPKGGV
jgi:hypothetical protein